MRESRVIPEAGNRTMAKMVQHPKTNWALQRLHVNPSRCNKNGAPASCCASRRRPCGIGASTSASICRPYGGATTSAPMEPITIADGIKRRPKPIEESERHLSSKPSRRETLNRSKEVSVKCMHAVSCVETVPANWISGLLQAVCRGW